MLASSAADQANALVRHLGDQIGLPSLSLDAQGACMLLIARRWSVSLVLDAARDTFYLSCPVTVPAQLTSIGPVAWASLLQTHHLGGPVPGASISVDPQGRVCVQQAVHLPTAPPAQILATVESLIGRAMKWAELLAAAAREGMPPPEGLAPPARRLHTHV